MDVIIGLISIVALICFFVMCANIGTIVKLLSAILKELRDEGDPNVQKAKKFDRTDFP